MSRHELSCRDARPHPLVPYVMAESAYWSEGMSGTEIDRHLLAGTPRQSLDVAGRSRHPQFDPGTQGLAHKMPFETDLAWTETTRALGEIPQYNAIDDKPRNGSATDC
ncbi:MAG: hypothetical protein Ct9H300mP1_00420 [Planctomycetaceae bacterium]|nr:MAG: hypothetical protein Ct9H300mP1_00420 [Planctomycetaceae bacterium]